MNPNCSAITAVVDQRAIALPLPLRIAIETGALDTAISRARSIAIRTTLTRLVAAETRPINAASAPYPVLCTDAHGR